jgi:hypothetical protein
MRTARLLSLGVVILAAIRCASARDSIYPPPHLASLARPCSLEIHKTTFGGSGGDALWLNCGCGLVRVTDPNNLVGKVTLRNADEALEFVRLFTRPDAYSYFLHLNGIVELVPGEVSVDAPFNVVAPDRFREFLRSPEVKHISDASGDWFVVTRCVVAADDRVYRIVEQVGADGAYKIIDQKLILESAKAIGVTYIGFV